MTVDVIIPCFNAERTIAATLDSALSQSGLGTVIVVNDGSTDRTVEIARSYGSSIVLLDEPNEGVSAARNKGIAVSDASWIVFLDADDILLPETFAARLAVAGNTGADVVICDWEDLSDDAAANGERVRHSVGLDFFLRDTEAAIASHVWATTAAIMYSARIVSKIGGFRKDLPVIQDARFLFDAAAGGARFAHSDHVGALYRISPGSLSRRSSAAFWRDVLLNGQQIEELWTSRGFLDASRKATLLGVYDCAGRGLFSAGDERYFDAVAAQRRLGSGLPLHSKVVAPLARLVGLPTAKSMISMLGRA